MPFGGGWRRGAVVAGWSARKGGREFFLSLFYTEISCLVLVEDLKLKKIVQQGAQRSMGEGHSDRGRRRRRLLFPFLPGTLWAPGDLPP
jgi:hypothetical protein